MLSAKDLHRHQVSFASILFLGINLGFLYKLKLREKTNKSFSFGEVSDGDFILHDKDLKIHKLLRGITSIK